MFVHKFVNYLEDRDKVTEKLQIKSGRGQPRGRLEKTPEGKKVNPTQMQLQDKSH